MRNHLSQHYQEFFTCLQCKKIFRTIQSFENHQKGHSTSHTCQVCGQFFKLKSSLSNHSQVHLNQKLPCSHANCTKTFKQRSSQLMHIQWGHRETRDVKCTHCENYYFTPNLMRSHRYYYHGIIQDITPSHPNFGECVPLPEQRQQQRLEKKKNKKNSDDAIPTPISGPLASPPPHISSTSPPAPVTPAPVTPVTPVAPPCTLTPGRRNRNRSHTTPTPTPPPSQQT